MIVNILIMIVIAALAALFFWLAVRAGRVRNWGRWPLRILAGLLGLVFTAVFVIAAVGYVKLNAPVTSAAREVPVTGDAQARTEKGLQVIQLCTGCHSTAGKLPLDGSADNFLAGGPPMGVIYAPNLTPGGELKDWTDAEIIRAIREGVDKDGRPLVIMPSMSFHNLSDEDVLTVVAGLRAQPAVDREVPERAISPLGAAMLGAGMFPTSKQVPITSAVTAPAVGTAEYGRYITLAWGCQDCHNPEMTGNPGGGFAPAAPDAKAVVKNWKPEDMLRLFREGKDPTGRQVSQEMPWNEYNPVLSDEQIQSLYLYLHGQ